MASVRPISGRAPVAAASPVPKVDNPKKVAAKSPMSIAAKAKTAPPPAAKAPGTTLDGSWDRKLTRGLVSPDRSVDLHGHGLQAAYVMLDQALEQAIADDARVLLLVTGKPPRRESERPHARGAIRAAVGDWLAASRHADRIAAVRGAHPRHGGMGALYIILRRSRVNS
jgi:DNA-nicking Smr family endonuclease